MSLYFKKYSELTETIYDGKIVGLRFNIGIFMRIDMEPHIGIFNLL